MEKIDTLGVDPNGFANAVAKILPLGKDIVKVMNDGYLQGYIRYKGILFSRRLGKYIKRKYKYGKFKSRQNSLCLCK